MTSVSLFFQSKFTTDASKVYIHVPDRVAPIMDCSDEAVVRKAIESDRQSVRAAKESWQNAPGKEASELTFRRFLSVLAQDIDV